MTAAGEVEVVLEREAELEEVATALRLACSGQGALLLLRGPIGCGKSTVLRALPPLAGDDVKVLRAGSSSLERDYAFGVVRQLIEPVLSSARAEVRERWLAGTAGLSRMVFADDAPPSPGPSAVPVQEAVLLGLTTLIGNISADIPLLILIDDIHWIDFPSLCLITRLARRSHRMRVLIVAAMRDGEIGAGDAPIAEMMSVVSRELRLAPLSSTAVRRFIADTLGQVPDEEFVLACGESSGGNPMILAALIRNFTHHDLSPTAEHAPWARSLRPRELRDRLIQCLRTQSAATQEFSRALAVLGEHADLELASRLAGLDTAGGGEARRTLYELGLLADEHGLVFIHLAVKDAIEGSMTMADREQLHRNAVLLLHRGGRPAEQVAARLLAITSLSGSWAVEVLRSAADTALRRGAPEVAARYLRRALLDASPDGEDRAELLLRLATVEQWSDATAAVRHLSYAVPLLRTARDKAAAVVRISPTMLVHDPLPVRNLIADVAAELGDATTLTGQDRDLALRLETRLRYSGEGNPAELGDAVRRLNDFGDSPAMDTGAERELLTVLAHAAMLTTKVPADKLTRLATRILEREDTSPSHVHTALPLVVMVLIGTDHVAPLVPWLDTALNKAQARQAGIEQGLIRAEQALALLYLGYAEEAKTAAFEVAACEGNATNLAATAALSAVALELRDPELTDRVLTRQPERTDSQCLDATNRMLRASVAAAAGDFGQALDHILECGRRLDRAGWLNPVLFPWQTTAAVLHHLLGHTDIALGYAEDARARAMSWGAPSAVGRALRTLGQLTPGQRGTELLHEAVSALMTSGNVVELAKAQVQLGTRLHLAGDPAAEGLLLAAQGIAVDSGVPWLAAQAGRRLKPADCASAINPRSALTKAEAKVADLAIGNHTNQEIAEILEVSSRAVEKHLTNSFRKLGIRRRTELADALAIAPAPDYEMLARG